MANVESTGFVQETYENMNRKEMQERLKDDKFYNYFYNLLENASNYCKGTREKASALNEVPHEFNVRYAFYRAKAW